MKFDTQTAAEFAGDKLDLLLVRAKRDTNEIIQKNDVPSAVKHYAELDELVDKLAKKTAALKKHMDSLSYEILPTMFGNQDVKTIKIDDVGRVTVVVRWTAKMLDKTRSMEWLRTSGNEGLVIETVNAQTLGAFAKAEVMAGKPLPDHLFQVSTAQHISITKE